MSLRSGIDLIGPAVEGGYAVPSFVAWDGSIVETILRVADDCRAPAMVMCGGPEFRVMPPAQYVAMVSGRARRHSVPVAVHLDHSGSPEQVAECIESGFTSVMLDKSAAPFDENAAAVSEVVALARAAS